MSRRFTFKVKVTIKNESHYDTLDFKINNESLGLTKIARFTKEDGYLLQAHVYKYDQISHILFERSPDIEDTPTCYEMVLSFKDGSEIIFNFVEPSDEEFDSFLLELTDSFK